MKKTIRSSKKPSAVPSLPVQPPVFQASPSSNNIVFILLVIVALFSVYLFFKVRNLEQKIAAGIPTQAQAGDNALSAENLKKYAKDMKLDTGKFNKCLDSGEKKKIVDADVSYGSSVGIQGTPGFFVNGRLLAGAFPYEFFQEIIDREIQGKGSDNCADYSENLKKYCSAQDPQSNPFQPAAKKIDAGNSPAKGPANAKVTIVEFSDFQCPFCIRAIPTVQKILGAYKNDVRLYYKHFPLTSIHPFAQKAAEASECAKDQNKFWEYHDKLFSVQQQPGT